MSKKLVEIYKLTFTDGEIFIGSSKDSSVKLLDHIKESLDDNIKLDIIDRVFESEKLYWQQYYVNHYIHIGNKLKNDIIENKSTPHDLKVTEKLQVLLSEKDVKDLYTIITTKALENGKKPPPISSYIRELIKDHIDKEKIEQNSYALQQAKKIIKEHEYLKNKIEDGK